MATDPEVRAFLEQFCAAVATHGLTLWTTAKNNAFLVETGFTNADVLSIIEGLRAQDYSSGPEADDSAVRPAGEILEILSRTCGL